MCRPSEQTMREKGKWNLLSDKPLQLFFAQQINQTFVHIHITFFKIVKCLNVPRNASQIIHFNSSINLINKKTVASHFLKSFSNFQLSNNQHGTKQTAQ